MVPEGPLVLLHAFPLNATQWRPQMDDALGGWRLIAADLPGFGSSNSSQKAPARSLDGMAEAVLRQLDALGVDRAVIGGLSMGGYLTLALYRLAPARFSGMILADTRATPDTEEQKDGRRKMIQAVRRDGPRAVADEMLPRLLSATSQSDQPGLAGSVRRMIEGNSPEAITAALEAMMSRPDSVPMLPSISVPALVICGADDVLTPPADSEALQRGIRGSRLVILPAAGHLSNMEAPDAFSAAVRNFLVTIPSSVPG